MSDWNPALYGRFEDERTRPAADLLARVPPAQAAPGTVFDLGCGPGNSTALLAARYGAAAVCGVDNSPAMVDAARQRLPGVVFERSDIATWAAPRPAQLLFANASLHWLPGHAALLPRLLSMLAPGGVLALQMPDNLEEPSHRAMQETALSDPAYAEAAAAAARSRSALPGAAWYHDLLAPRADVEIWRTTYHHALADPPAIVDWLRAPAACAPTWTPWTLRRVKATSPTTRCASPQPTPRAPTAGGCWLFRGCSSSRAGRSRRPPEPAQRGARPRRTSCRLCMTPCAQRIA